MSTGGRPSAAEARAAEQAGAGARRAAAAAHLAEHFGEAAPGRLIVRIDLLCTLVFGVVTVLAMVSYGTFAVAALIVDCLLTGAGLVAFCAAIVIGAQRSRTAEMDVVGWFFLGKVAPSQVRRPLLSALVVQVVLGLLGPIVTRHAALGSGDQASKLAFGVLVPLFGLALCGVWGARHGLFPARPPERQAATRGASRQQSERPAE